MLSSQREAQESRVTELPVACLWARAHFLEGPFELAPSGLLARPGARLSGDPQTGSITTAKHADYVLRESCPHSDSGTLCIPVAHPRGQAAGRHLHPSPHPSGPREVWVSRTRHPFVATEPFSADPHRRVKGLANGVHGREYSGRLGVGTLPLPRTVGPWTIPLLLSLSFPL